VTIEIVQHCNGSGCDNSRPLLITETSDRITIKDIRETNGWREVAPGIDECWRCQLGRERQLSLLGEVDRPKPRYRQPLGRLGEIIFSQKKQGL
jgi:hypothetical protein